MLFPQADAKAGEPKMKKIFPQTPV